jgi:hypothetical protein
MFRELGKEAVIVSNEDDIDTASGSFGRTQYGF